MKNDLPYDAIIFDVDGTLVGGKSYAGGVFPRSPTLIQKLIELKEKGVKMFAVSMLTHKLEDAGFPKDLMVCINPGCRKDQAIKPFIERGEIDPKRTIFFGDDKFIDGASARMCGIDFILVQSFSPGIYEPTSEVPMEIENHLQKIFPVKKESKLPLPKGFRIRKAKPGDLKGREVRRVLKR